jgi:hypothetical protein
MSSCYDSEDEEFDLEEEENLAMIMALRASKQPKHGFLVFAQPRLWRERIEGHNKLMMEWARMNYLLYCWWTSCCIYCIVDRQFVVLLIDCMLVL